MKDEENADDLQKAEEIIIKTNPLLLQLLKGKEELLEQMYRQLIFQKLPSPELLKSFGKLENVLKKIFTLPVFTTKVNRQLLTNTVTVSSTSPKESDKKTKTSAGTNSQAEIVTETTTGIATEITTTISTEKQPEYILERFIQFRFSEEKIIKDFSLHSTKLNYLLPERKLAILLTPNLYRLPRSFALLVRRAGLTLIIITPQDLQSRQLLAKKFSHYTLS
jgi:hypothetical protein